MSVNWTFLLRRGSLRRRGMEALFLDIGNRSSPLKYRTRNKEGFARLRRNLSVEETEHRSWCGRYARQFRRSSVSRRCKVPIEKTAGKGVVLLGPVVAVRFNGKVEVS